MTKSPLALLPILLAAALLLATGCSSARPTTAAPGGEQDARPPAEDTRARKEEACVDKWLSERGLDQYGSPEGTMYAGGTPLFDEQTGRVQSRLEHVYAKHPAAKESCTAP